MTSDTITLSFADTDAERILSQVTSTSDFLNIPTSEFQKRHWERERRRLTAYELHAITLAEYYKVKRIPRGLRVHLRPTFFPNDPDYSRDFEKIINKCSYDLILLTINRIQTAVTELQTQILATEQQLRDSLTSEEFGKLKESVDTYIATYKRDTEEKKRSKFLRDSEDYHLNRVYRWQDPTWRQKPGYRRSPRPGSFTSSSGNESTGPQDSRPFLRRGRRPRGGGGGVQDASTTNLTARPGSSQTIQTRSQTSSTH
ncbi:uncharacterized protein LOC122944111 [Bufo gargarizans]|uniref:uncharacterized protein LOC122919663 n=1 Tax=Bufo gargarizans TaxID=30331 RepID=UPI001CF36074|nr:uncharacterized protein LOC122919663 [Bufo gargarizans]XP_044138026.1 uncharacterized protein LOC122928828 [Bufo gargarizans]XP_044158278.1 uncharacterized protein LOC122944111 [Bufo gargarizans]